MRIACKPFGACRDEYAWTSSKTQMVDPAISPALSMLAIVTGWRQRPNGVKYVAWDHPLSPSYKDVKGGGWITQLAKSGIGYRDWVAIALGDAAGDTRRPAHCITIGGGDRPMYGTLGSIRVFWRVATTW